MLPPFTCTPGAVGLMDTCSYGLYNSSCINNTITGKQPTSHYCLCPTGWNADMIIAHFENCMVPDSFPLIMGIIVPLVQFPVWLLHVRLRTRLKGQAQNVSTATIFFHSSMILVAISIALQRGMYEAGLIFTMGMITSVSFMISNLFTMFVQPVLRMAHLMEDKSGVIFNDVRFFKGMHALSAFNVFGCTIITIACISLCRHDPYQSQQYDQAIAVLILFGSVTWGAMSVMTTIGAIKLEGLINNTLSDVEHFQGGGGGGTGQNSFGEAKRRIQVLKILSVIFFLFVIGPFICVFTVLQVTGTFPGLAWLLLAMMCAVNPMTWLLYRVLRTERQKSQPSSRASKNDTIVSTLGNGGNASLPIISG